MAYTSDQITNLNNSMEAARVVGLGTQLANLGTIASGSVRPTASTTIITTGLTTVKYALATLSGSPAQTHMYTVATTGSVAGKIWLYHYALTSGSWAIPTSASSSWQVVSWLAVGT